MVWILLLAKYVYINVCDSAERGRDGGGSRAERAWGRERKRMNECSRKIPPRFCINMLSATAKITLLWHLIDHVSTASLVGTATGEQKLDPCLLTPKIVGSVI